MHYNASVTRITPKQAKSYLDRWKLVSEAEAEEVRRTPMETKLRQLAALMASRHLFAPEPDREGAVRLVRERWTRLRQTLGG